MTRIEVEAAPTRARVGLSGDVLRPRLLHVAPESARVALVPTGALLLGGDQVTVDVVVGDDTSLEIVETAGTVAYPGAPAEWHVRVRLGRRAVLVWAGLPFVVCEGAEVRRSSVVDLDAEARAVVRETIVLGRAGERGAALRITTAVRLGSVELLREDLDLDPGRRGAPGILGQLRVLDTVAAYGFRPARGPAGSIASPGRGRLDLAGPGALERFVGLEAHHGDLTEHATGWAAQARAASPVTVGA